MNVTCCFSSPFLIIILYLMTAKPSSAGIYHIDGTLHCRLLDAATLDTFPLGNTTLQVFDEDVNLFGIIDQDDLLAQTRTTLDGKFSLDVEESELFGHPDFYIVIHHTCVYNIFPKAGCHIATRFVPSGVDKNPEMALKNLTIYLGTLASMEHIPQWATQNWEVCDAKHLFK